MRVSIVGGGITGCVTALRLAREGHDICVYERGPKLGGALLDLIDNGQYWHKGCQYLSPEAPWYKEVVHNLDCEMSVFPHKYAAKTTYEGSTLYRDDLALPSVNNAAPQSLPSNYRAQTLADRFRIYGHNISNFLIENARRTGHDPDLLDEKCALSLQLSMVNFNDQTKDMLERKQKDPVADTLFALPRDAFGNEVPTLYAALPVGGYHEFFKAIHSYMEACGIRIILNSRVTAGNLVENSNHIAALLQKKQLHADCTVWCCNPVPLIMASGIGRLDSPAIKFLHIHGYIKNADLEYPVYIQNFDPASPVYRLYLYPTISGPQICIECFSRPKLSQTEILKQAHQVLKHMHKNAIIHPEHEEFYPAHFLFTQNDNKKIQAFEKISFQNKFISGAWEAFGRDNKIQIISNSISEFCQQQERLQ